MGAFTEHGVWDAGFSGRGEFILNVTNNAGIRIKQNARLAQLIFYEVAETESYNGIFKQKR
jgi:deoxycytidine triphosphate deaminase